MLASFGSWYWQLTRGRLRAAACARGGSSPRARLAGLPGGQQPQRPRLGVAARGVCAQRVRREPERAGPAAACAGPDRLVGAGDVAAGVLVAGVGVVAL